MDVLTGKYRHSKTGRMYNVIGIAKHSETHEDLVVYEALYSNAMSQLWVRPLPMFYEQIDINGVSVPRFVRVE